jgi:hypothetical protein
VCVCACVFEMNKISHSGSQNLNGGKGTTKSFIFREYIIFLFAALRVFL